MKRWRSIDISPELIQVKHADLVRGPPEAYKNESRPRGVLLIANWVNFGDNKDVEERGSSRRDVENIEALFSQMGYECARKVEDLTKEELLSFLKSFKDYDGLKEMDSFVGVFMSHGREDAILTKDGNHVTHKEIFHIFNGKGCPGLLGKPKLFVFEHCRCVSSEQEGTSNQECTPNQGVFGFAKNPKNTFI